MSGFAFAGFQLVEKSVKALEVGFPETPVPFEPDFKLLEGRGAQGIDAALRVDADIDKPGITEDAKMLGDLGLAEMEAMDHEADGARTAAQEFDDVEAVRLGEGPESGDHGDC